MTVQGKYIVLEGNEGTGKSTQRELLISRLQKHGISALGVDEPGKTPIGIELRKLIKNASLERTKLTNFLLFTANRVELWQKVIEPALLAGTWVIADRNWLSSLAIQGHAEGLSTKIIRDVTAAFLPESYMHPSVTILLHVSAATRHERLVIRGGSQSDNIESRGEDFLQRIDDGYNMLAKETPELMRIAGDQSARTVHEQIWQTVKSLVKSPLAEKRIKTLSH